MGRDAGHSGGGEESLGLLPVLVTDVAVPVSGRSPIKEVEASINSKRNLVREDEPLVR